jgi:hypothetical protein
MQLKANGVYDHVIGWAMVIQVVVRILTEVLGIEDTISLKFAGITTQIAR